MEKWSLPGSSPGVAPPEEALRDRHHLQHTQDRLIGTPRRPACTALPGTFEYAARGPWGADGHPHGTRHGRSAIRHPSSAWPATGRRAAEPLRTPRAASRRARRRVPTFRDAVLVQHGESFGDGQLAQHGGVVAVRRQGLYRRHGERHPQPAQGEPYLTHLDR